MNNRLKIIENTGLAGCSCKEEAKLASEGWERRYVADQRAAREAEENYSTLGYEVLLMKPDVDTLREECSGCRVTIEDYRIVFTRKK